MLAVSEIFYTLQGEGKYVGFPAVFVRLGGCNLKCPGFSSSGCDSSFSVDPSNRSTWTSYSVSDLIQEIKNNIVKYPESTTLPMIIFTGGEPTLYQQDLAPVVTYFVSRGYKVQFETNASIEIKFDAFPVLKQVSFAMSVKLSNSKEPEHKRINLQNLEKILLNTEDSFFKFVCRDSKDIEEASNILKEVTHYADVYIMPMGETVKQIEKVAQNIWEECMKYGFKYSDRLHIRIYND